MRRLHATSDDPFDEALDALTHEIRSLSDEVSRGKSSKGNGNGNIRVPTWVAAALFALMISAIVGLGIRVMDLSTEMAVVRGNRFTAQDWATARRDLETQIRTGSPDHEARISRLEEGN